MQCVRKKWPGFLACLGSAFEQSWAMALWSSLPWLIGWATLTMMGPVLAARVLYRAYNVVVDKVFYNDKALCGKVIMITGASSGLGEAMAHALYKRGARLILASRSVDKLTKLKDTLLKSYVPPELHMPSVVQLDLEDLNNIAVVAKELIRVHGHIDVLINNAGISYRGAVVDTDISVDIKLMVINYFAQVALTKALLPTMLERGSGHIIAVGSVQSKLAIPYRSCYTASKHAMQGFFDSLRAEVADRNVKVSVINPGYISTNLSLNAVTGDGSTYGNMDATTASGMKPEEVAEQIVSCIISGYEELVLAPLSHRVAINLRTISPSLLSRVMKRRAAKQKNLYASKDD
ncbi:dehydrogenase/reductase SDR family protein 7-like isoform X1 [Macrobrachium nipponense]|uniref:dehydrogenase/reductase SDR family protein 7-like isoform X1 n=1 Tax=Macrobrachium nipponense TaxID=159736 RepID=UPI0030C7CBE6